MRSKWKIAKVDEKFLKELKDIERKRVNYGKDDPFKPKSIRRYTAAIRRHNFWPQMKEDIINAELVEEIE